MSLDHPWREISPKLQIARTFVPRPSLSSHLNHLVWCWKICIIGIMTKQNAGEYPLIAFESVYIPTVDPKQCMYIHLSTFMFFLGTLRVKVDTKHTLSVVSSLVKRLGVTSFTWSLCSAISCKDVVQGRAPKDGKVVWITCLTMVHGGYIELVWTCFLYIYI